MSWAVLEEEAVLIRHELVRRHRAGVCEVTRACRVVQDFVDVCVPAANVQDSHGSADVDADATFFCVVVRGGEDGAAAACHWPKLSFFLFCSPGSTCIGPSTHTPIRPSNHCVCRSVRPSTHTAWRTEAVRLSPVLRASCVLRASRVVRVSLC